jgi:DNA-binding FadR family transcriptional regulator
LKTLAGLGVLESRNRSGTFVRSLEPLEAGWEAAEGVRFGVLELLEARRILEPRAAWLAATRATERDLLEIESARQKLETHEQDWRLVARLDSELHAAIIRGARNPALDLMNQALTSRAFATRNLIAGFAPDVARMRADHKAIVDAILMRQADAAEKAMADHLQSLGLDFISEAVR